MDIPWAISPASALLHCDLTIASGWSVCIVPPLLDGWLGCLTDWLPHGLASPAERAGSCSVGSRQLSDMLTKGRCCWRWSLSRGLSVKWHGEGLRATHPATPQRTDATTHALLSQRRQRHLPCGEREIRCIF